ncbi:MAG TPA: hypothetical protein VLE73_00025 [Candidatus Saccharimonadales bacterium]|nr:hypothetical protein [Candidatus Saccharimonadales bacterium]
MSPEQVYLRACNQRGLIIDTNLLALLLIGSHHPTLEQIRSCTRTSSYDLEDFKRVLLLASKACKIIVTPQILAELADITFDIRHNGGFDAYFKQVIDFVTNAEEEHTGKELLMAQPNINILRKVGFADTSIVEIARNSNPLVLTDDGELAGVLTTLRLNVLNINHLRSAQWLASV